MLYDVNAVKRTRACALASTLAMFTFQADGKVHGHADKRTLPPYPGEPGSSSSSRKHGDEHLELVRVEDRVVPSRQTPGLAEATNNVAPEPMNADDAHEFDGD
jgi:hypothetical protein